MRDIVAQSPVFEIKGADLGGLCQFDTRVPAYIAYPAHSSWHGVLFRGTGKIRAARGDTLVWLIDNKRDFTREIALVKTEGTDSGT
ncbi:MAG: hypothetical protein AAGA08_09640 [Pseudomonadota bacterium]